MKRVTPLALNINSPVPGLDPFVLVVVNLTTTGFTKSIFVLDGKADKPEAVKKSLAKSEEFIRTDPIRDAPALDVKTELGLPLTGEGVVVE